MLSHVPRVAHPNVLVGFETSDDAGVYKLTPECALVQTVDFFTPIVDDPFTFGAIAAANALSDVYAMGGEPISALSILAYPAAGSLDVLEAILQGGSAKLSEAGCPILGGHSINEEEIKFGYSITGTVHPDRFWRNSGAMAGDILVFTKRLGTGIISTALKRGIANTTAEQASAASMLTLNRAAAAAARGLRVHACTDVSGFGLLGHAREMAVGSGVTLAIEAASLRLLPGVADYLRLGAMPGGLANNREFVSPCVLWERPTDPVLEDALYDPQTSGGLLFALPPEDAAALKAACPTAYDIGEVLVRAQSPIVIR